MFIFLNNPTVFIFCVCGWQVLIALRAASKAFLPSRHLNCIWPVAFLIKSALGELSIDKNEVKNICNIESDRCEIEFDDGYSFIYSKS